MTQGESEQAEPVAVAADTAEVTGEARPIAEMLTANLPVLARLEPLLEKDRVWYALMGAVGLPVLLLLLGAPPILALILLLGGAVFVVFLLQPRSPATSGAEPIVGAARIEVGAFDSSVDQTRAPSGSAKESAEPPPNGGAIGSDATADKLYPDVTPGAHVALEFRAGTYSPVRAGVVVAREESTIYIVSDGPPVAGGTYRLDLRTVLDCTVSKAADTIVRTYPGHQQADANAFFQGEARYLSWVGYQPSSQSWAAGQWGCGAFVVAVILMIALIGILIFIYMLLVKPDGSLTVTYARSQAVGQSVSAAPPAATDAATPVAGPVDRLRRLDEAKSAGLISDDEYVATRARILNEL